MIAGDPSAISARLAAHAESLTSERVTLADIQAALGEKSICVWLLVLALPMVLPIPAPGISVLFGIPLTLISAELSLGYSNAWLPARLTRLSLRRTDYAALVARMHPAIRRLERLVRPRARSLASPWMRPPVGLICLILAAIITLPVPLGHVVPGTAICLLALGLMEGDGVVVGIGILTSLLALALVLLASAGLLDLTRDWFLG